MDAYAGEWKDRLGMVRVANFSEKDVELERGDRIGSASLEAAAIPEGSEPCMDSADAGNAPELPSARAPA